jgi:UDP-N-acetylglucosamine--N-acetylmuramyl-(pentapeptide) pyrophosphoryl-undecaprenol N-acetylglucosamine transferase
MPLSRLEDPATRTRQAIWAVVAGGGTAGHFLPALAVARRLVERGHPPETIHFIGSARGLEAKLLPSTGFGSTLLPGRGVARRLTADNVSALTGLAVAVARALALLYRRRPSVVLSVGGYAGIPAVIGSLVLRIPLVIHEQNAVPGLANRLAGRFALASAVSFPRTELPRAVVTGNPVRPEVLAVDRSAAGRSRAREALGLPQDRMVLAAFGGSLGARRINQAVRGLVGAWSNRHDLAVCHVVGSRDWPELGTSIEPDPSEAGGLFYRAVEYEERMPLLLGAADLALCRAGGTTVAELAAVGLPAVLVPLPGAPHDHQTANATALVDAGAAVLLPDDELSPERLMTDLDALLADADRLAGMAKAASSVARPDAADRVASLLEHHARR